MTSENKNIKEIRKKEEGSFEKELEKMNTFQPLFDVFPSKDENTYIYLRVSTDKQTLDGQIKEVYDYCIKNRLYPPFDNIYWDYAVSGSKCWKERELNNIVDKIKKGGILIVPELSRLGRNMGQINGLVEDLVGNKNISIHDIKNNLKVDGSLQSKILSTIMNMSAELERELTRERIRKGMQTEACKLKLKQRASKKKNKMDEHFDTLKKRIEEGITCNRIAKEINVNKGQVYTYAKKKGLLKP